MTGLSNSLKYLPVCLSAYLSICLSICCSICVYLSVYLPICLSICCSICCSICFVCLSISLSLYLSIYLSIYLSNSVVCLNSLSSSSTSVSLLSEPNVWSRLVLTVDPNSGGINITYRGSTILTHTKSASTSAPSTVMTTTAADGKGFVAEIYLVPWACTESNLSLTKT